jgi:uncharacterized protein
MKMTDNQFLIVEKAKEYAKKILNDETTGHDYNHVLRVYNMALRLSEGEIVNLFVISLAAILHDLDDYKIAGINSNRTDMFLESHNVKEKNQIIAIIDNMSYSSHKAGHSEKTIEGQIVQDADRLDALGAIGIARCFAYGGKKHRSIYKGSKDDDSSIAHFYQKLLKLPDLMNTEKAKLIAIDRLNFMKEYLKHFYEEWE